MIIESHLPALPELEFARIPVASQSRYLGDRYSFMQSGDPKLPCLLLLHGIGANSTYFRFQFEQLADSFHVVAWNAPGYWMSDALAQATPHAIHYAQAVADFVQALNLKPLVLAGNSFGSVVAQAYAMHDPQNVQALVLTGTGVGQKFVSPERRSQLEARTQRITRGSYSYGDNGVDALVGPDTPGYVKRMMVEVSRGTQASGLLPATAFRLSDFFTPDHADQLTMPVLMMQGSEDRINPRQDNADLLLPKLSNGRLELLPGIGHLPEIESPLIYAKHLKDWVQGLSYEP
jgi:pimeloyl-ACP methyl ester carboxylesterase